MSSLVLNFESLVAAIAGVHERLHRQAINAVNTALTLRNWLIGAYIHEYELGGQDRAAYGERLMERLSERLQECGVPRTDGRELRRYRLFYLTYPQIRESLTPELVQTLPLPQAIPDIRESPAPETRLSGSNILRTLSFTHLAELLAIEDPLKRTFYEVQSSQGGWSVRELRRQVASLLYERVGLSHNKWQVLARARAGAEATLPAQVIRDPYVFEFLGLRPQETLSESALEDALLAKLQDFLLELGRGFCFEASQKRLLIGGEYFFVDLVFYHRILKCHVLIELKVGGFSHEHLGQLNAYLNWFVQHEMAQGDNPPVGILLCTEKNHALVEYALAGMDNQLFVSKYQLALPRKEEMRRFLEKQMAQALAPESVEKPGGPR